MPHLGIPELVLVLVIVMIVFGVGRLGDIGGAIGKGIREFRKNATVDELKKDEAKAAEAKTAEANKA